MNSDAMISTAPDAVIQKLKLLRNGKLTSRAPICSGTTKFMRPVTNGIATKKIMITPCAVKTWSKWCAGSGPSLPLNATACCMRINTASEKPRRNMISPSTMYMMPIFL